MNTWLPDIKVQHLTKVLRVNTSKFGRNILVPEEKAKFLGE